MTLAELHAVGFDLDAAAHARLVMYVDRLLAENEHINLTGTRDPVAFWAAHVCDSLALVPHLRAAGSTSLVDLGSGGGLPGVPLACAMPGLAVTLLDATRKKLAAVERICEPLCLTNLRTVWGRAETLAHEQQHRERYDVLTARAVGPLARTLELASGLVRPGGTLWFYKSCQAVAEEVRDAAATAKASRLECVNQVRYSLPVGQGERALAIYLKAAPLPRHLPRSADRIAHGRNQPRRPARLSRRHMGRP